MKSLIVETKPTPGVIESVISREFSHPQRCGAESILERLGNDSFDAVFLDQTRLERDAAALCSEIRNEFVHVPIMVFNRYVPVPEVVRGLDAGADDYVFHAVSPRELIARIRALLRRRRLGGDRHLRFDELELDRLARVASRGDISAELSGLEFALLQLLMENPERLLSRAVIADALWGTGRAPVSNSIEAHVSSLRRKVEPPDRVRLIHTVPRRGYRFGYPRGDGEAGAPVSGRNQESTTG